MKTGMYYLRTRPAVDAVQFTVDKQALRGDRPASRMSAAGTEAAVEEEEDKENIAAQRRRSSGAAILLKIAENLLIFVSCATIFQISLLEFFRATKRAVAQQESEPIGGGGGGRRMFDVLGIRRKEGGWVCGRIWGTNRGCWR